MDANLWINEAIQAGTYGMIAYLAGRFVEATSVKVNYTRKINFFAIFLVPLLLARLFPYERSFLTIALRSLVAAGMFIVLIDPIRTRVPVFATMFRSFDRPEDRPHTLWWLSTQIIAGNLVLIPMSWLFASRGISELMFVPVLIHGIGDGLAEPVGIRWGRHKYTTRAFLSAERRFTRSYEGSACVFITGLLAIALFHEIFTATQFIAALFIVPIIMTLAEAWSPHTWDTPYMFFAGTASVFAVKALV
jgi:dolichol kinase